MFRGKFFIDLGCNFAPQELRFSTTIYAYEFLYRIFELIGETKRGESRKAIDRSGYLVQLLPGAEFALGCRGRSDEVHAGSSCDVEHGISGRDGDGETLGMGVGRWTTWDRGAVQTLTEGSGRDIVVQKLAVNGQHHCETRVAAWRRFVNYQADLPRRG